jgi:aquaporin Z
VNIRALVAEAFGTFTLIIFGSLGIASALTITNGQVDTLIIQLFVPFTFGLGLMAAIAIGGHASGGHFNPAVTLAAYFDSRLDWKSAVGYVVAQVIGGLSASLLLLLVTSMAVVQASVNSPGPTGAGTGIQELHAFAIEIVLTALFVATILTVTRKAPEQAIIVIPLTLVAIHFAAIPLSGASVNPVRSLAPAVVSGTYDALWIYLVAPFAGSAIGWAIYRFLTPPEEEPEELEYIDEDLEAVLEELEDDDAEGRPA